MIASAYTYKTELYDSRDGKSEQGVFINTLRKELASSLWFLHFLMVEKNFSRPKNYMR